MKFLKNLLFITILFTGIASAQIVGGSTDSNLDSIKTILRADSGATSTYLPAIIDTNASGNTSLRSLESLVAALQDRIDSLITVMNDTSLATTFANDSVTFYQESTDTLHVTTNRQIRRQWYTGTIASGADSSSAIDINDKRVLAILFSTSGTLQAQSLSFKVSDGTTYFPLRVADTLYTIPCTAGKNIVYWMEAGKMPPMGDFKVIGSTNETSAVTVKVLAGGGF